MRFGGFAKSARRCSPLQRASRRQRPRKLRRRVGALAQRCGSTVAPIREWALRYSPALRFCCARQERWRAFKYSLQCVQLRQVILLLDTRRQAISAPISLIPETLSLPPCFSFYLLVAVPVWRPMLSRKVVTPLRLVEAVQSGGPCYHGTWSRLC
jgi:hypothetical protein